MELSYTRHARERMVEREITPAMVADVIENATRTEPRPDGKRRHHLEPLRVVTADDCYWDDDTLIVVTVEWGTEDGRPPREGDADAAVA